MQRVQDHEPTLKISSALQRKHILLYAIILLGAALRFYQLGHFSLWDGEIFTLFISQKPLDLILPALRDFGAHPPMWFFITRAFNAFGWNEWMLRAPATLVGILTIPALYLAGKRAENRIVGLLAALLCAVAPIAVLYSQVGRMYSVILPLTALALYALTRALQTRARRWWFALALCSALLAYNQYLSLLAVGSAYLMAGLILFAQTWQRARPFHIGAFVREFFRRSARMWASFAAFFILLAPLLPLMQKNFFQRQLVREATTTFTPVTINADFLRALFLDLAGNEWLLLFSGLLVLTGILLSLRKRDYRSLLLLVTWFGLVFAVVTVIHPRRFPSRYVLHLVPIYLLLTAHGLYLLGAWASQFAPRANATQVTRACVGLGVALLCLLAFLELASMYRGTQEISRGEKTTALLLNGGWRELAHYLNANVAPGDLIVYGGDGPLRPPRFIAPYVSAEYQMRAHSASAPDNAAQKIWWVGVNLSANDIVNPTDTQVAPLRSFGDTSVALATRPVQWQSAPLPASLEKWQIEVEPDKPGLTVSETQANAEPPIWSVTLSAPVNARLSSEPVRVAPGQLFRVTARVRGVSEGFYDFSPGLYLRFYNAQGKRVADTGAQTLLPADAAGWQTLVLDGAAPPNAATARLVIAWSAYSFTYAPQTEMTDLRWQLEQLAH